MDLGQHKPDTLNLTEDKVGNTLECIDTMQNFLNRISMAQALRSIVDKWNLLKMKSVCKAKDITNTTKQQPMN